MTSAALRAGLPARLSAGILKKIPANKQQFSLPGVLEGNPRVLLIDSGDMTDLLFFTPFFRTLRSQFPGCYITVLVRDENAEVIRSVAAINEILTYDPAHIGFTSTTYFSLMKKLRKKAFDVSVLMGREFNLSRAVLGYGCGAALRVGGYHDNGYPYVNCEIKWSGRKGYEAERAHAVGRALGVSMGNGARPWALPEQDLKQAEQLVHFWKPEKDQILVGFDPGQGKEKNRVVDQTQAFLLNHLAGSIRSKFLLLPGANDPKSLTRMKGILTVDQLDLEPKSIKETLALLANCDLFLGGNTDLFHFAVAMGIPTVGLFTDHDGIRWVPRDLPQVKIFRGSKGEKVALADFLSKVREVLATRPQD